MGFKKELNTNQFVNFSDDADSQNPMLKAKKLKDMPNVMFYLNKMPSRPQGDYIDNIHKYW